MSSVFEKIDSQTTLYFGFSPFAILWNIRGWRRYILVATVASAFFWMVFGFDSTWEMLEPYLFNAIPLLLGQVSLAEVSAFSQQHYGLGNHWSSPVIYGSCFLLLSLYLERIGIKKSLNFVSSASFTFMSIGVFEWIYNLLYSSCQNQPWTIMFKWKQVTNLTYFTVFTVLGILMFLYLGYKPNFGRTTKVLFASSLALWLLWIFFPFPIGYINIETTGGVWTNTPLFPQTMYAVDMNPLDNTAIGVPYFVDNPLLHFVNVLAKVVMALLFVSLCRFKGCGESGET